MNIKKELFEFRRDDSSLTFLCFEFLIISLLVWYKFNFLAGTLVFILLSFSLAIPVINKLIALVFVIAWTVTACCISYNCFSLSTTIGITILTLLFSSVVHFGAVKLAHEVTS